MNTKPKTLLFFSVLFFILFAAWTVAVKTVCVCPAGPDGSYVGFACMNTAFHRFTGVHWFLYNLTDILSVIPLGIVAGFAVLGLVQLCKRKSLKKVDADLYVLGGFYIVVLAVYGLFEILAVNYRPVLVEGVLEASYPSSTTVLSLCVLITAVMQFGRRIQNRVLRLTTQWFLAIFTGFMVVARTISGVHWLSDIIGGVLISTALILLYRAVTLKTDPS